jgi:hypothetical protein
MTVYKYLPHRYADPFVTDGAVLFRSLLYFLACEDARRDELEGTHQYAPTGGLQITNHTAGWARQLLRTAMRSRVKHPEQLFVFCTSRTLTKDLARKFEADACVEIGDVGKFTTRLRTALRRNPRVKLKTLLTGDVEYYRTAEPPEAVWALPHRIVMNKPHQFAEEHEFRVAFSLKADAFDFQNVDMSITTGPAPTIPLGDYPQMLVKLGSLADCCRIHTF